MGETPRHTKENARPADVNAAIKQRPGNGDMVDDDDDFNNESDPCKPAKAKQQQHQDETLCCEDGDSENMEQTRTPRRLPANVMQSLLLRASASAEREQSALHASADQSLSWDIGSKPLVGWAQSGIDDGLRGLLVRSELCRGTTESAEIAQALAGALARRQGLGTLEISSHSLKDTLVRLEASSSNLSVLDPGTPNDQEDNQAIDQVLALLAKQQDRPAADAAGIQNSSRDLIQPSFAEPKQSANQPKTASPVPHASHRVTNTEISTAPSLTDLLRRPSDATDAEMARNQSNGRHQPQGSGTFIGSGSSSSLSSSFAGSGRRDGGGGGGDDDDDDMRHGQRSRSRRRPAPAPWARAPPGTSTMEVDDLAQESADCPQASGFVSALSKFQTDQTRRGANSRRSGDQGDSRFGRKQNWVERRPGHGASHEESASGDIGMQSGKPSFKRRRGFRPPARVDDVPAAPFSGSGSNASNGAMNGGVNGGGIGGRRLGGRPGASGGNGGPAFNAGKAIKRALADQQNDGPNASAQGNGADGLPPEYLEEPRLRGLDPALIERIESEVLQQGDPVTFDDIAGLRFAKENIEEIVVWPLRNPEYYTGLRQLPKGLLLFGPPGTGKTLIGKAIAHEVSATFFSISASSLTSKWIGEGEKTVRALFGVAAVKQPSVVFIDEVDSLLTQRTSDENEASRRIKTEFLVQLDGAATSAGERVLVIGATNRPQELDEAARRRFIKRLYIPLPDDVTRTALLRKLLSKNEHSLTQDDIVSLCAQTDGYSGADVTNLAREASMGPLRDKMRHRRQIEDANTGAVSDRLRPICYQDFQVALRSIRASVSQDDLRFYIRWNEEFGTQEYAAPESAAGATSSSSSSALSSSS